MLPNMSPSTKAALSSENLWVPALAGIGSMLASQRPTLGGAVGEGLVGGASAYTGLQKQQADIEKAKAETGLTKAQTSRARIFIEPTTNTRMLIYADPVTGNERMISLTEAQARIKNGETFGLEPGKISEVLQAEPGTGGVGGAGGAGTTGNAGTHGAEKPPAPPAPGAEKPPTPAPGVEKPPATTAAPAAAPSELSDEDVKKADLYRKESEGKPADWFREQKDIYTPQQEAAKGAAEFRSQFQPMAAALSGAPRKGPLAAGPLRDVFVPLAKYINNIADVLQFKEGPFDQSKIADAEEGRKYVSRLREAAANKGDFKAVSALSAIEKGYPSDTNTARGIAKLLAGMSVEAQRDIDKNEYFQNFKNRAESGTADQMVPNRSGSWANLHAAFDKSRDPVYQKDKATLERMYTEAVSGKNKAGETIYLGRDNKPITRQQYAANEGQPMTVAEWIIRKGADMTDAEKKWVATHYGPRTLRYFGMGG
jgi:hypothetical protein